jgi:hypothetical protein
VFPSFVCSPVLLFFRSVPLIIGREEPWFVRTCQVFLSSSRSISSSSTSYLFPLLSSSSIVADFLWINALLFWEHRYPSQVLLSSSCSSCTPSWLLRWGPIYFRNKTTMESN